MRRNQSQGFGSKIELKDLEKDLKDGKSLSGSQNDLQKIIPGLPQKVPGLPSGTGLHMEIDEDGKVSVNMQIFTGMYNYEYLFLQMQCMTFLCVILYIDIIDIYITYT